VPTTVALSICAGLAILALPLAFRLVGPNRLYGFRTRATLSDPGLWYSANALCGRALLVAAILSAALVWSHPSWFDLGVFTNLAAVVVPCTAALIASFLYVRYRALAPRRDGLYVARDHVGISRTPAMRIAARNQSPRTIRVVAGLLAAVWLAAGVAAIAVALSTSRWLLALVGLVAAGYGAVWLRAARQGRLLSVREALAPWRIRRGSDS